MKKSVQILIGIIVIVIVSAAIINLSPGLETWLHTLTGWS